MMNEHGKCKGCHGVCLIILGVLIWLNAAYGWLSWSKFVAVIAVLLGIKMLILAGSKCCKAKK